MILLVCAIVISGSLLISTGVVSINLLYAAAINRDAFLDQSYMPARKMIDFTQTTNLLYFDIGMILAGIALLAIAIFLFLKYKPQFK